MTRLTGTVTVTDVRDWIATLDRTVDALPDGSAFKLLFDLHGYEPASLEAHKLMRTVVPQLLADHGLRPSHLDLFDEEPEAAVASAPRTRCVAFANLHHNADRMADYQARAGKPEQRFFAEPQRARQWITEFPIAEPERRRRR